MFRLFRTLKENPKVSFAEDLLAHEHISDADPIEVFEDERVRIRLFLGFHDCCVHCGYPVCWMILDCKNDRGEWDEVLSMHEECFARLLGILQKVSDSICGKPEAYGPRNWPHAGSSTKTQEQLRSTKNPHGN
jgi:hypothetical protein